MTRRRFLGGLGASALGLAVVDAALVEPNSIEVTRHRVEVPGVDAALGPLRIGFMADFHLGWATSRAHIRRAVELCAQERPDVVLMGGDFVARDVSNTAVCAAELAALRPPLGIYFILGNHDYMACGKSREALCSAGFRDMTNCSIRLLPNIHLVGLDDYVYGRRDVARAFAGTEEGVRLAFSHNPEIFREVRDKACVLLCGHTHGARCRFPW